MAHSPDKLKSLLSHDFLKLLLAALLLAGAYLLDESTFLTKSLDSLGRDFEETLHKKEKQLHQELIKLGENASDKNYARLFKELSDDDHLLYKERGFFLYVYQNDSLKFWSDDAVPVDPLKKKSSFHSRLIKLKNGWFEVLERKQGIQTIVGLLLIKHEYAYQNKYLVNRFHPDFGLSDNVEITFEQDPPAQPIFTADGIRLCSLKHIDTPAEEHSGRLLVTFLNILGLFFLMVFLRNQCRELGRYISNNWTIFIFFISLVGLRAFSVFMELPEAFYEHAFFGPSYYAASVLLPSLGDLFVNVLLLFYLAYYFRGNFSFSEAFVTRSSDFLKFSLSFLLLVGVFAYSVLCEQLIFGLVENSNISFNVNNLFGLNVYSYVGIGIIGMLFFTFFLLADKAVNLIQLLNLTVVRYVALLLLAVLVFCFHIFFEFGLEFHHIIWPVAILGIIIVIHSRSTVTYSFANIVVIITVFSVFAAHFLYKYSAIKEVKERKVLAEKLSDTEDPLAELLYANFEQQMFNDKVLQQELSNPITINKELVDKRLLEKYFTGYFSKYGVNSYLFLDGGNPISATDADKRKHELVFFESLLARYGRPTLSSNFYFIDSPDEKISYVTKIPLVDQLSAKRAGVMYITFESKLIPEEIGFPELLLDKGVILHQELSNYSFAKYRNNKLARQYGDFAYSMRNDIFGSVDLPFSIVDIDNYGHLLYQVDEYNLLVLSKKNPGVLSNVTTFSYLFAFFGLFLLFLIILRNILRGWALPHLNFNNKIQLLLVFVIITSLVLFGVGTTYYITKQYQQKNYRNISERIHSVLIEVEHKLGGEQELNQVQPDYMTYILTKFSSVFYTDINLYDLQGTLLASSRKQLFNQGLVSTKMDPYAFFEMAGDQGSEFIHDEQIGKLKYLSAYVPFKNQSGETLAYLNLPYFAKQNALEQEISSFLVALINIYVFLFALSVVAALLISNIVTKPLRRIQRMLSTVELGKTNTPIEYKGKDEIGSLVAVYNSKVAELEESAELLAKSERESAWREMAKQVAHEIKNPLTPMKLSIQHLQRSLKDHPEDWNELLDKFGKTIIEQIDTLSHIADEFSNFAKMPKAVNEKLELGDVLSSAIDLFEETPKLSINFDRNYKDQGFVFADKEQLLRVFNNLIKNAIQAMPEYHDGVINIRLSKEGQGILVEVEDNGTGITPDQIDKIFTPNFTTKTAGMGLGLAMVKSMVESANGKIWFETQQDEGTTFFVWLPEHSYVAPL